MKKPAIALLLGAVLLGGILFFVGGWFSLGGSGRGSRDGTRGGAGPSSAAPALAAELETPRADTTALETLPVGLRSEPEAAVRAAAVPEREARASDGSGRRISGHVRVPSGAPADDSLRVLALSQELAPRQIYGTGGSLAELADGKDVESVVGSAAVGADGSFELALGTPDAVWLALDGRFLYSSRAQPAPAGTSRIELAGELGGCLVGRVLVPGGAQDPAVFPQIQLELRADSESFSIGARANGMLFGRAAVLDGEGRFELRALPAGPRHELELDAVEWADQKIDDLVLEPGRVRELELTLLVGATVAGRVVDEDGRPLAESQVIAAESGMWGFTGEELAETDSDADGSFVLAHVAPGKSLLIATLDGFLASEPLKLELADGQHRGGLELRLGRGAAIAGRVRLPNGTPCEGVEVKVSFDPAAMMGMGALDAARGAEGEAKSAADGRFEVTGLGKGPFQVQASIERKAADASDQEWTAKVSGVKPGTRELELTLGAPLALHGRVLSADGAPIQVFRVQALEDTGVFYLPGEMRETRGEDPEGDFVLRGLAPGKWKLEASSEGFGPMTPLELTLPRADETPLELVLTPAATIAGQVVDPRGTPVAGAHVTTFHDLAQGIERMRGGPGQPTATSREDGSFLLTGLASGTSSIFAVHENFAASEPASVTSSADAPASGVVLKLRKGALVTGEVYGRDGKPAGGVQLIAQQAGSLQEMNTSQSERDGTFRFEALAPGSWTITALLADGEVDVDGSSAETSASFLENMRFTMVQLEDGEEEHVVLGAPPKDPVLVRGRVMHAERPVTEGLVSFVGEGAKGFEGLQMAPIGADGRYKAELDAPGAYVVTVQITAGGGTFQQNNVEYRETIPEKPEHTLDISLPLGALRGTVLGPDRKPMNGARVTLATVGGLESGSMLGGHYSEATTDEDGHYSFEYLRPGSYSVAAGGALFGGAFGGQAQVGRLVRGGLEVDEGRALEGVDFQLDEPGDIKGRVVDAGGAGVKDAALFVRDASGQLLDRFSMTTSAADGSFTYTGVAPGEYVVSARGKGMASEESAPVRIERGGSASVELVVQAGTKLVVEVVDEEGNPKRALVSVTDARGREMQGMLGWAEMAGGLGDGFDSSRTNVGPLAPGNYTVTAASPDGKSASRPVNLDGQSERRLKLRLR